MCIKRNIGILYKLQKNSLKAILFTLLLLNFTYAKELVFAAADTSPTAYMKDGKVTGLLVDIMNEAFKRIDHPIEIKLMPWARCLREAKEGKVDGVFSSFKFAEREAFLTFTQVPIITQIEAFFVRADSDLVYDRDLSKFENVKIGVIRGTSYGAKIDNAIIDGTWKDVVQTDNIDSMISMLVWERFDLMPSYRHVVLHAAKKAGVIDKIKELSPSVDAIPSYLAFTKKREYTEIITAFNKAMSEMIEDGTYDLITDKYLKK